MDAVLSWLTLKAVPGLGNLTIKKLYDHFGSVKRILKATKEDLLQVEGVSNKIAKAVINAHFSKSDLTQIDLAHQSNFSIATLADSHYPVLLHQIPDPPPILFVNGQLGCLGHSISVVGSRKATDYGLSTAFRIGRKRCENGITVVSGMAKGIDGAAHEGALAAGGKTIAVLGSGLLNIYPQQHADLYRRISKNGAVISEFPLNAAPKAHHFPARNRIISGMSLGTVVIEASLRSGALITARLAADQNREVFAIPGSINSALSAGTHRLIQQGAKLIDGVTGILEEFEHRIQMPDEPELKPTPMIQRHPTHNCQLSTDENRIITAMASSPIHIDDLSRKTDLPAGQLAAVLLKLELKGVVKQTPGNHFKTIKAY